MKFIIPILTVFICSSAFLAPSAQASGRGQDLRTSPGEACSFIAGKSSFYGSECAKAISKADYFDPYAPSVCVKAAATNAYNGLTCMKSIVDNFYVYEAAEVCGLIAEKNSFYGSECIKAAANKEYRYGVAETCKASIEANAYNAFTCMRDSGTAMDDPGGNPGYQCISIQRTIKKLRRSLQAIGNGRVNRSESIQRRLLNSLKDCQDQGQAEF